MNFLETLKQRPLLVDGGMGTTILARGIGYDESYELLNIQRPELIGEIHRGFVQAGAEVIETNTFGANRVRQEQYGQQHLIGELNAAAVRIARNAAGRGVFVVGAVGPLGARVEPLGAIKLSEAYAVFREQIEALANAGVDALVFETQSDLGEIEQAIRAARDACDKPIIALMTFGRDNRTLLGNTPVEIANRLAAMGVDVMGANCSTGPQRMIEVLGDMARLRLHPLLGAMPNAGYPEVRNDRLLYPSTPKYFGESARRLAELGVHFIGGCCGTTPEHTRAMREALATRAPVRGALHIVADGNTAGEQLISTSAPPTALAAALAAKHFVMTVELEPPRSFDTAQVEATARMLKGSGATVLDIADAPLAKMRLNGMVLAHRVQERVGIETILHFPVRGRSLLRDCPRCV